MIVSCIQSGLVDRWVPFVLDFRFYTWAIALEYVGALALIGWRIKAVAQSAIIDRAALTFWTSIGVVVFLLFLTRLFALEAFTQTVMRCAASAEGVYRERRPFQRMLIAGLIPIAAAGFSVLFLKVKAADRRIALAGAAGLVAYVVIRAVSLHKVDGMLVHKFMGFHLRGLAEALALGVVIVGAAVGLPAIDKRLALVRNPARAPQSPPRTPVNAPVEDRDHP